MADTETLYRKMLRLVLPISFQQFMLALVGASDAIMLGKVSSLLFSNQIMRLFTNEPDLIRMGSEYLRYVGISYLFSAIAQVCLTIMKNCGAVNQSTVINSLTVILNMMLNAVLIFGFLGVPAMGIRGAALATVTATTVQMILSVVFLKQNMNVSNICLKIRHDLKKQFWTKTAPVLLNELIWGGGFTMYSVIMGHLGANAVAANSIANISKNLVVCFCLGLGSGGSIIVGNELGANHFEEAKRVGRILTRASVIGGILSGLFLLALSPAIISLVDLTLEAKKYLSKMLVICSYYIVGKSINSMTIGGIFPAGGDSKFGLFCDIVTLWCITIPLGCFCAFVCRLPILFVYFVLNLDEIVKLPVVYWHYKKYGWVKNITNGGFENE